MLKFVQNQDILQTPCEAIVNPVNCVGVMGKGLALAIKNAYPSGHFSRYQELCKNGALKPGEVNWFYLDEDVERLVADTVIFFPTKNHWRDPSRIEWIESGLKSLDDLCHDANIETVALPRVGCGLGGLEWKKVRELMVEILGPSGHTIYVVYE